MGGDSRPEIKHAAQEETGDLTRGRGQSSNRGSQVGQAVLPSMRLCPPVLLHEHARVRADAGAGRKTHVRAKADAHVVVFSAHACLRIKHYPQTNRPTSS